MALPEAEAPVRRVRERTSCPLGAWLLKPGLSSRSSTRFLVIDDLIVSGRAWQRDVARRKRVLWSVAGVVGRSWVVWLTNRWGDEAVAGKAGSSCSFSITTPLCDSGSVEKRRRVSRNRAIRPPFRIGVR